MGNCCKKGKDFSDLNEAQSVNIKERPKKKEKPREVIPKEETKNNADPEDAIFMNFEAAKHEKNEGDKAGIPPKPEKSGKAKPPLPKKDAAE